METLFEQIYSETFKKVYAYFNAKFGAHTAEDLSQRLYTRLWGFMSKNTDFRADNWSAWVFRLAVNVKNDYLRERYRSKEDIEEIPETGRAMDEPNIVFNALRSLPNDAYDLLVLKHNGFNSREIGEMLQKPETTIRSRVAAAKKLFAKALVKEGVNVDGYY
jgi:RNA polymerase sigma factor (sigma-70 family)